MLRRVAHNTLCNAHHFYAQENIIFIKFFLPDQISKVLKAKKNAKPVLSAEEMDKIYALADQMDQMQRIDQREAQWSEEDLIDLFQKKTIH